MLIRSSFFHSSPSHFFFRPKSATDIHTLSLHDALPISSRSPYSKPRPAPHAAAVRTGRCHGPEDRKSTRLNSSHRCISYAVFCLKKKSGDVYSFDTKNILVIYSAGSSLAGEKTRIIKQA